MKDEINILIADDNADFVDLLKEYMDQHEDINVVGIARDGLEAVDMILSCKPEVVILDIIMPNLDGIGVLERLLAMGIDKKPLFIMLSAIGQDVFIHRAVELGAEYYIMKPFDVKVLVTRIRQLYQEKYLTAFSHKPLVKKSEHVFAYNDESSHSIEVQVTRLMHEIGIPPHMAGYQYLREAIIQTLKSNKRFSSITKTLYPGVAEKFNTTPQKVERAIRNAIESAWSRGSTDSIDALFGCTINYNKSKPTNSECIAAMVDKIRINMGK